MQHCRKANKGVETFQSKDDDLEEKLSHPGRMAKQGDSGQGKRGPVEAAALFPRLHVSHVTRDSGPRPPPRNKMALYEQVTVQSSQQIVSGSSAGACSQQQEEVPGGSGMQAPKSRVQIGGSLPSMSNFSSRYDYPQHSLPHSFSSGPSYYQQSTFQSCSLTGSQGTGLRLPSGASSVGSASEWDANESQVPPPSNHYSQIVPVRQPSGTLGKPRKEEVKGCVVPTRVQSAINNPPSVQQDVSGRWAWWSWQQRQGLGGQASLDMEDQSQQRDVKRAPPSLRGAEVALPASSRKTPEPEASVRRDASVDVRAQRLALLRQAAADWKTASLGEKERQHDAAAQQSEAAERQAVLDCQGAAIEEVAAAERRAGAMRAQEEVAAQIQAASHNKTGSPEQGLVPVLEADSKQGAPEQEKARKAPLKLSLSIEVPQMSAQAELDGNTLGEPEGSVTQEVASGLAEATVSEPGPSVNKHSGSGIPKQRHYKPHYAFQTHFPPRVALPLAKGHGDSSPEVIEGSEGGASGSFKDVSRAQKAGGQVLAKERKRVEGGPEAHKGRKRASAQANKATQEAAAAVAAKAGPSPSGSSSGDRSGGAGDGALSEQDMPSVCDEKDTVAESAQKITPKEVVSVIGQHGFWKSRKAMQQQQKKFSAQLFEMHRLVKVQKMFAENPSLTQEAPPPPAAPKRLHDRQPEPQATQVEPEKSALSDSLRFGPFSLPQNSGSVSHADAFKAAKTCEFSNPGTRGYVASKVAQISNQYGPREAVIAAQEAARLSFQEVSSVPAAPVNVQAAEALALVAQRVGESCSKLMAHRAESEKTGGAQSTQEEDSGAQVVLEEATRLSATLEAMRPHLQGGATPAVPNPWLQNPYAPYYSQMFGAANPYLNPAAYMRQAQSMMTAYPYDPSSASFYGGEAMSAPPTRGNPYAAAGMYPKYDELAGAAALSSWMQNPDPMTAWLATMAGGVPPWGFGSTPAAFPSAPGVYPTPPTQQGPFPAHPSASLSSQSMPFQSSWNSFRGDDFASWDKGAFSGAGDAFSYEQFRPRSSQGPADRDTATQSISGLSHSRAGPNARFNLASQSSDGREGDWGEQSFGRGEQNKGFPGLLGKRKETESSGRWQLQAQDSRGGAASGDTFREGRSEVTQQAGSFFSQSHRMKGGGKDSDEDALHVEQAARIQAPLRVSSQGRAYVSPELPAAEEGGNAVNELQLFPVKSDADKKGAAAPIKVVPRAASETPDLGVSILASIRRER